MKITRRLTAQNKAAFLAGATAPLARSANSRARVAFSFRRDPLLLSSAGIPLTFSVFLLPVPISLPIAPLFTPPRAPRKFTA